MMNANLSNGSLKIKTPSERVTELRQREEELLKLYLTHFECNLDRCARNSFSTYWRIEELGGDKICDIAENVRNGLINIYRRAGYSIVYNKKEEVFEISISQNAPYRKVDKAKGKD